MQQRRLSGPRGPDANNPFLSNDAGNQGVEGLSQRHGGGYTKNPLADVKGGASVGLFSGAAQNIKYFKYHTMSGQFRAPAELPNDLWCAPDLPSGGRP